MNKTIEDIHVHVLMWLEEAAHMIRDSFAGQLMIETKANRKDLVTNIDKNVQDFLIRKITEYYPTHQILGEESAEQFTAKNREHIWIIDPIDGTANFVKQQDHFCILISYYENDIGKLGYMYDVMNRDIYYAIANEGVFLNDRKLSAPPAISLQEGLVAIDVQNWCGKSCLEELSNEAFDIRYFGCGGIDSIHVITGKFAAFATSKAGPWDKAAQLIFAKELGLRVSRFDGSNVNYLEGGDWIIANQSAYEELLAIVKKF
ncbi:inositol monophosphatase family protein [Bacillus cihuensis]|uniref:inositol monophosphatase family protein n=1 Tax=Bacillus cihuensis TaxID=1208599 RepID=UPI0003F6DDD9|nr:inositol monophosphatase family protein [Bacillus cihuensis]